MKRMTKINSHISKQDHLLIECSILEPYVSIQLYFELLVFFLLVSRVFVGGDGSSKSPLFYLPAVPKKLPVFYHDEKVKQAFGPS